MNIRSYFIILLFYHLVSPFQWLYLVGETLSVDKNIFVFGYVASSWLTAYFLSKVSRKLFFTAFINWILFSILTYDSFKLIPSILEAMLFIPLFYREHFKSIWRSDKNRLFRSPRKKIPLPVSISSRLNQNFTTFCYDISLSGFFVSTKDIQMSLDAQGLKWEDIKIHSGNEVDIKIQIGTFRFIKCSAKIVRIQEAKGNYPSGVGFQFSDMNFQDRSWLRKLMKEYNVKHIAPKQKMAA